MFIPKLYASASIAGFGNFRPVKDTVHPRTLAKTHAEKYVSQHQWVYFLLQLIAMLQLTKMPKVGSAKQESDQHTRMCLRTACLLPQTQQGASGTAPIKP